MPPCIQAKNVSLTFRPKNRDPVTALDNLSLEVARGEFLSIVGPSDCGKSTFLNILLGLFRPKNRDPVTALDNLSLEVARGEFLSIVGPSGCGKSTFLNILLGLIRPDAGVMELNGRRIDGPGQDRAMVFQEFGLLPWRTV